MPLLSPQSPVKKLSIIMWETVLPGGAELQSVQRALTPSGGFIEVIVRWLFLHVPRTGTHASAFDCHVECVGGARLEGCWSGKRDPQERAENIGSWPPAARKWATR